MGPKPKPKSKLNTRSGAANNHPASRKWQASNADQQPSKRTRRTTNEADYDDNDEPEVEEEQDGPEEEEDDKDDEDDEVEPPPLRGGKRGRGVKIGPPQRYVGHDRRRSCPFFFHSPLI